MPGRELADASRAKTRPSPKTLNRQREERDTDTVPSLQHDPMARLLSPVGAANSAAIHASLLNRVTASQPSRARSSLLHLQQQRGNRYVQRVVSISRQGNARPEVAPEVEQGIQRARSGGQNLDRKARAQMESAFDADFTNVRVHTNSDADTLNHALGARAFTTGRDIFFRRGEYNPGSSSGRELLAHELTHVVQQSNVGVQGKLSVSQPGDVYEREADEVAKSVMQRVQRQDSEEEEEPVLSAKRDAGIHRQAEEEREEESVQTKLAIGGISQTGARIQREKDRDSDGSQYVELEVPDGTYVLEVANVPATARWDVEFGSHFNAYASASQYSPRHIYGLNADPHRLVYISSGDSAVGSADFRIKPGRELESAAGEGSVRVDGYRHNTIFADERRLHPYLRFDTVPLIASSGDTSFIAGNLVDIDPSHHHYISVTEGSEVGRSETHSTTVSDGVTFSHSRTISNTIGHEITAGLGAELGIEGVGKITGSTSVKEAVSRSVSNTIGESYHRQIQQQRSVTTTYRFTEPGQYAIVPTARVWQTSVTMNLFDSSTGKRTSQRAGTLYTIIYNPDGSTARVINSRVDPSTMGRASSGE
jgi:hypothetical protein